VEVVPTAGKAGVFATLDATAPTTLATYFMYDVKQYDAKEWSSPSLEARMVDHPGVGKDMIGRGATNAKGPQLACLAALHAFKSTGTELPVNLVLICEGEEEIGSPNFSQVVFKPEVEAAPSSRSATGSRWLRAGQSRRQGDHRARARVLGREMGAGA
jgi:acetylornithine deacetylase/succinyl-diaminopimelate desuccinylase-like protein